MSIRMPGATVPTMALPWSSARGPEAEQNKTDRCKAYQACHGQKHRQERQHF